jgi:HAE1 family hydrophobic/amphiphilic exporter-1
MSASGPMGPAELREPSRRQIKPALERMIMASLYESLAAPFIIFLTIPLAVVGVIVMLLLTGTPLSVVAFIGVIMLAGIVVNNSIVLVDYINQLRARGYSLREAVMEGGRTRLRPILMTALTTILALIPLALGLGSDGEAWSPMARSVIGGLTASTLLTLLVIPVIYTYLAPKRVKQSRREGPAISETQTQKAGQGI